MDNGSCCILLLLVCGVVAGELSSWRSITHPSERLVVGRELRSVLEPAGAQLLVRRPGASTGWQEIWRECRCF